MTGTHIIGVSMLKTGRLLERSVRGMAEESCCAALSEAGVAPFEVQAVWFSNTRQALMEGQNSIRGQVALREGQRATVSAGFGKLVRGTPHPPRSWCERAFNVVHWTEFPEGGHFPAMEVPNLLLDDLRRFFA